MRQIPACHAAGRGRIQITTINGKPAQRHPVSVKRPMFEEVRLTRPLKHGSKFMGRAR
jgi:hypothetical protein